MSPMVYGFLLLVAIGFVGGFVVGAFWMWRITNAAIDEIEDELP